jgi:hypothetical protein
MDEEPNDTVEPIDTTTEIEMLLEEAEAFKRGGAPLEALARARVARQVFEENLMEEPAEEDEETDALDADEIEELRARIDAAIDRYERLVAAWQNENADRKFSYLTREQAVLHENDMQDRGRQR